MARVEAVQVFTDDPNKGNLAGVVLDAEMLSDEAMQSIAYTVKASETSFVLPSRCADLRVRWFTPSNEVGICVHATIAAVGVWAESRGDQRHLFSVETKNAVLQVKREGANVFVNVPGYSLVNQVVDGAALVSLLGIGVDDFAGTPRVVRIYEDLELVVPLKSLSSLERLAPRLDTYTEICRLAGVTGMCLFARESYSGTHDVHMREFAPLYGYLEDPLCGMASGCVLTFLRSSGDDVHSLKVEQGQFCGTSGTILVRHDAATGAWIGGEYALGKSLEVRC